jgi:hypothetical protein
MPPLELSTPATARRIWCTADWGLVLILRQLLGFSRLLVSGVS